MRNVLITWVGLTDLRAPRESDSIGLGPIAQALDERQFGEAFLLTDRTGPTVQEFVRWLRARTPAPLTVFHHRLSNPMNFEEIYEAAVSACAKVVNKDDDGVSLTFHLSPGTPAMAAIWILLAKTRYPAELIESSRDHGVQTTSIPFEISMDFIPDLLRERDARLRRLSGEEAPEAPEFADIIHRSDVMSRLIERARRVALHNVPVLIEGESGTGKEMLARAIHRASPRRDAPFVAVNCGAIPGELVESELFGHEKGAFTGATQARPGYFESADHGTLFLDEVGELPGPAQVKLLRVLQDGEVVRVGSTKSTRVDLRMIAATNRILTEEIAGGRFREDLFYRLAVAVLKIPPLRDRSGDVGLLLDRLLQQVNREVEPGHGHKVLSAGARNLLLHHPWPGNVRELMNTLRRAAIWSEGTAITAADAADALLPASVASQSEILSRPLGSGLRLPDLLRQVAQHYLSRALDEAHGNKTRAAELVGLPSYQTLTNWLDRYGIKHGTRLA